jgi:hypothetical protein
VWSASGAPSRTFQCLERERMKSPVIAARSVLIPILPFRADLKILRGAGSVYSSAGLHTGQECQRRRRYKHASHKTAGPDGTHRPRLLSQRAHHFITSPL